MLLSKKRKFIFIHIYKNAGSSITRALLPHTSSRIRNETRHLLKRLNLERFGPQPYPDHIRAAELLKRMGPAFHDYFSFAIIRNPWDWQVSLYTYMLKHTGHSQHQFIKSLPDFDAYIDWRCRAEVRYQKDFLFSTDGEQLVDFIGRFENLENDFQTICERIGVRAVLPRINVSRSKSYREYYNPKTIEMVRDTFGADIQRFNYEFE